MILTHDQRFIALVLTMTALLAACGGSQTDETGGCARPSLLLSAETAAPGDSLKVQGGAFLSECGDVSENGHRSTSDGAKEPITLYLVQADERIDLGQAKADSDTGDFEGTVTIPQEAEAGPATIETSFKVGGVAELRISS